MSDGKITCHVCGAQVHAIQVHLKEEHPEMTLAEYREEFPEAPLLSAAAKKRIEERKKAKGSGVASMGAGGAGASAGKKVPLHEAFGLGKVKAALSPRGEPILISIMEPPADFADLVPEVDENYVFDIDLAKTALMGLELNIPSYLWGHAGTGKTTMWEQVCARTKRPFLRVQHTVNTEESHIVGQWTVKDGHTVFELGPLAVAMKYGLTYVADEYDFAMPSVLSVYQPVLEGKPLVIKEADHDNRIIRPHPDFRFVATGNTNGCGDETGLYQGTNIQNAANYERFGIVEEVSYMEKDQETMIVAGQASIPKKDAADLVKFAGEIRTAFAGGKIGATISPRALINAARIGIRRASYKKGLELAFMNRMSRVDREVASQFAQRIFG
jgi:cobaltochelatase CobS